MSWLAGVPALLIVLVLAGCGGGSDGPGNGSAKIDRAALAAAEEHIVAADRREIELVEDQHMIGPPSAQTVRAECLPEDAKPSGDGAFELGCTSELELSVAPVPVAFEDWTVRVAGDRVLSAKPLEGYDIRGFFEADHVYDCSRTFAADVQAQDPSVFEPVPPAIEPCYSPL